MHPSPAEPTRREASRFIADSTRQTASEAFRLGMSAPVLLWGGVGGAALGVRASTERPGGSLQTPPGRRPARRSAWVCPRLFLLWGGVVSGGPGNYGEARRFIADSTRQTASEAFLLGMSAPFFVVGRGWLWESEQLRRGEAVHRRLHQTDGQRGVTRGNIRACFFVGGL